MAHRLVVGAALCLLSLLVPFASQAQTVTFLDEQGAPATVLLDGSTVGVRVTDPTAYSTPGRDTVSVTVTSDLGGDSVALTLLETGPDTRVFEGLVELEPNGPGYGYAPALTTATNPAGPARDTLLATYGSATATAGLVGSRIFFLDDRGRESTSFLARQPVGVRVRDELRNNPQSRDSFAVTIESQNSSYNVTVPVSETGVNSGVFEGSFGTTLSSEGLEPGHLVVSIPDVVSIDLPAGDGVTSAAAQAPIVGSRVILHEGDGEPAGTLLESAPVQILLIAPSSSQNPIFVQITTGQSGDTETLILQYAGGDSYAGQIPTQLTFSPAAAEDGFLQVSQYYGPPSVPETVTVTYIGGEYEPGTSSASATFVNSRIAFVDAWGRETSSYVLGSEAHVRFESQAENTPALDTAVVRVRKQIGGSEEYLSLVETRRGSGVFTGSLPLEELGVQAGDRIEASYSPDLPVVTADIVDLSLEFLDERGEPTQEIVESGPARVRMHSVSANLGSSYTDTVSIEMRGRQSNDLESLTLTETGPDTNVFEGSIRQEMGSFGSSDGRLQTANSGPPDYRQDEVMARSGPVETTARTIGARIEFVDALGRKTASYAAGEAVRLRIIDHFQTFYSGSFAVTITALSNGDTETIQMQQVGSGTGIFEGLISTVLDGGSSLNGTLGVDASDQVEVRHVTGFSPIEITARTSITASSIAFVDAAGQPATVYLEGTRAYVRVVSSSSNANPGLAETIPVQLVSEIRQDSETVTLTETGPNTGVFQGSIKLRLDLSAALPGNGVLETTEAGGGSNGPHEFDTLTATFSGGAGGTVEARIGLSASRTWFGNAAGTEVLSYAVGATAHVWIEDQNRNQAGQWDTVYAEVTSPGNGEQETLQLQETARDSGIFHGTIELARTLQLGDGKLYVEPGGQIEATHQDAYGATASTAVADISGSSLEFIDEDGQPASTLAEEGDARVRVFSVYGNTNAGQVETVTVNLRSRNSSDQEPLQLTETGPDTSVFEGSIPMETSSAYTWNGTLETLYGGYPVYGPEVVTAQLDSQEVSATVVGARIHYLDAQGRVASSYVVGETVRVRVIDYKRNYQPGSRDSFGVTVTSRDGGDLEGITVLETGVDTGVFVGSVSTVFGGTVSPNNGQLSAFPEDLIEVRHVPNSAPEVVATATMQGNSVTFIDAAGQPATVYLESSRAYVRVVSSSANTNPSMADTVPVQLLAELSQDNEILTLTETGPSTNVFEGSIPLRLVPGTYIAGNGILETTEDGHPQYDPPHETDTLRATYSDSSGTSVARAGLTGSRTWFADAAGQEVLSFPVGGTAHVRVEDQNRNQPGVWDRVYVALLSDGTNDQETVQLLETTRDSGVFVLAFELASGSAQNGDGKLQVMPGSQIEAIHADAYGATASSAVADISDVSITFIDETGEPTTELLEKGDARVRMFSLSGNSDPYSAETQTISLQALRSGDNESLTLTETGPDTGIFEGSIPMQVGGGYDGDGFLGTITSNSPEYLPEEVTAHYGDSRATAFVQGARVRFVDAYGRETASYAAGEPVRLRVIDHNYNQPTTKDSTPITVTSRDGADSETLYLQETGFNTAIFEAVLPTTFGGVASPSDGNLRVYPEDEVEARYLPYYSSNQIVAKAAITGNAVLFVDAAGQPATVYLESSRAHVRVVSTSANTNPSSANTVPVQLQAELSQDNEILTLTETGPNTSVFEGSIPLRLVPGTYIAGNGILETAEDGHPVNDPPHELDTLRATYSDPAGMSVARIGLTGSRTWFGDAAGQVVESYAVGGTAWVWVEDQNRNQPGVWDTVYVEVISDGTGDQETVQLLETTRDSGVFVLAFELASGPAQNGDGKLQVMPGSQIEAIHPDAYAATASSAVADISDVSITFIDEAGEPTTELLEKGDARVRMFSLSGNSDPYSTETQTISLRALRSGDDESLTLTETGPDTSIFEGSIPVQIGGGYDGDGFLGTINSASPEYLPEEVTAHYGGSRATAFVQGARVRFVDAYGRETASYAAGEPVRLRVIDHNYNQPTTKDSTPITVTSRDGADSETLYLQETGFNTAIFEAVLPTTFGGVASSSDGNLRVYPEDEVEARYLPSYSSNHIVAQAAITGNAVLFVDAAGQPATVYLESSRAHVRVVSTSANTNPSSANTVPVQLQAELSQDNEILTLTETGPNTSVFQGSIALRLVPGTYIAGNGILETAEDGHPVNDPPHEFDTLRATYSDPAGTSVAQIGLTGSRTWFGDATGQVVESYAVGGTAWVWVEDQNRNQPGVWDTVYVEVISDGTGDQETLQILETTRDSGVFRIALDLVSSGGAQNGDGKLQVMQGYPIRAIHADAYGATSSTARAETTDLSIVFIDETGEPTTELLEKGEARVRMFNRAGNPGPYEPETRTISLQALRSGDVESLTLTETGPDTGIFEGSIPIQVGGGYDGDGFLGTINSGSPEYLPEEVTAYYGGPRATAFVQGALVRFVDAYGRETASYAAGESVRLRVVDHNYNQPTTKDSTPVTVRSLGRTDVETLYLQETGFNTAVFEGVLPTALDGVSSPSDGTLHVDPTDEVEARYLPYYSSNQIVAQAAIAGNAVLFIDAAGQPATVFLESSRAFVRVVSSNANSNPSTVQTVPVQLLAELGQDTEILTLTETGPNTAVFEGSIALRLVPGTYISGNGILETAEDGHPVNDPPHEFDTLRATYSDPAGTSVARIGLTGSRTWFGDAAGQPAEPFAGGSTAWVWVEDHNRNQPGVWDRVYVEVRSDGVNDVEQVELLETTRDSGIFRFALHLGGTSQQNGDGKLMIMSGYPIHATHMDAWGATFSSAVATTSDLSITFIDETGEPTTELLEKGEARVRMFADFGSNHDPYTAETVTITLQTLRSGDVESLTLTETGTDTHIFEGSIPIQVGGGYDGDGFLGTINSASPEYLPEEVTAHYYGPRAKAFVMGARVRFVDAYGRETASYAAGESVRLRVVDHNYNQPTTKDSAPVTVRSLDRTDVETLYLQETGFNTAIFEGSLPTALDGVSSPSDGTLHVDPTDEVEARYLPYYSSNQIVAQAAIAGNAVLFIDAAGQPATVYLESSRAYVRVVSSTINTSPSLAEQVPVQLLAELGQDTENLMLTETGPNTSVFEGSIPMRLVPGTYISGNGILETAEDGHPVNDPPHEFDTLRATYSDPAGTSVARIGLTGSRIWFGDAAGQPAEPYAAGSTVYVWVEDHNRNQPGVWDTVYVELYADGNGDQETVQLRETTRDSGVFVLALDLMDNGGPQPGDGKLEIMPGYPIRATHQDAWGATFSSVVATTTELSITFLDEAGEPTTELLEKGAARVRMLSVNDNDDPYTAETQTITLQTLRSGDAESVTLTETGPDTNLFEGSIPMQVGGGADGDGFLGTIHSGSPEYLPEEVTAHYYGPRAKAFVMGARVRFVDAYGRETASYAAGESVRLRVVDHNYNQPTTKDSTPVTVRSLDRTDVETLYLQETGFNTSIFEGALPTSLDGVSSQSDGTLHINPVDEVEARYLPYYSSNQIVAQAAIAGNAVLFIDAAGQPATVYLESSRAYVRVVSSTINTSPSLAEQVPVQLLAELSQDTENLMLTETGPNTSVFEGSIPMRLVPGTYISGNGILETTEDGHPVNDPPHEFDMLRATYSDPAGTSVARIGLTGSRTWFGDATGQEVLSYAAGGKAYIWVEDQNRNQAGVRDLAYVEVRSLGNSEQEQVVLWETTRDSGIFVAPLELTLSATYSYDEKLMVMPGYQIEAIYQDAYGATASSAVADITDLSITFIDEAGEPTTELLERGDARVRLFSLSGNSDPNTAETRSIALQTLRSGDVESLTLTETGRNTGVFEGSIPMQVGGGADGDGVLSTINSGSPEYLPEEVSAVSGGRQATARVLGARVTFIDAYGGETATFAAGESVRVRVVDHNANQPSTRDNVPVTVTSRDGIDSEALTLLETGFDTAVFEGSLPTVLDGAYLSSDGNLRVDPGDEIQARYLPNYSPNELMAQGTISGNAVLFIDAAGQPATIYLESSQAYVRVVSTSANTNASSVETVPVQLLGELSQDTESLTLTETGPNTSVFEGSIPMRLVSGTQISGNGILETIENGHPRYDQPHEIDTVRATYSDPSGTSVARIGLTGSRVWFVNAAGEEVSSYPRFGTVHVRVEDQNRNQPGIQDNHWVGLTAPSGDFELVNLLEIGLDSGIFAGSLPLGSDDGPESMDGVLGTDVGDQIEARANHYYTSATYSSAFAVITAAGVEFIDETGAVTQVLLEGGQARVRVFDRWNNNTLNPDTLTVQLQTERFGDVESLTLLETGGNTNLFEGSIPMSVGLGVVHDGILQTRNSGSPDYQPDVVTALFSSVYGSASGTATVLPSRVDFLNLRGQVVANYPQGSTVRVRVTDHNRNLDPGQAETFPIQVHSQASNDTEEITLTETGADTGVFEGSVPSTGTGTAGADGVLVAPPGLVETEHGNTNTPEMTPAQVTILSSSAPTAGDDTATVVEDDTVLIAVLANDTGTGPLTLGAVTQPAHGSLVTWPDHKVTYTPTAGYVGPDTFTYLLVDAEGGEDVGTVTVTVTPANQAPTPAPDNVTTPEDQALTVAVLANDTDPNGDPLDVVAVTQPAAGGGAVVLNADDTVTYTPEPNTTPVAYFTYTVRDPDGAEATATVRVEVTAVNDAPVANDDTFSTAEDTPLSIEVRDNDSDIDSATFYPASVTTPANGTAELVTGGMILYTPNPNFTGTDTFSYILQDDAGASDTATVTITVTGTNDAPVANDDTATVDEDGSVNVSVLANDTDPENDTLDVTAVTQGTNGAVVINPDETVTYTPNANFNGTDSFTYTIEDGNGGTATATVTVTITGVNDSPVANADAATVAEDGSVSITVLGNDTDPENDTLDVTAVTQGANGSVVLNANETVTYTPSANFSGTDSFTYTISDGNGGTATATVTVTITGTNDAPVANADTATVAEDGSVSITVLTNDTDPENDTLDVTAVTQGTNGSVTLNANETVTYTPNANFYGSDAFTYTISDGNGGTAMATVTITVTTDNDAPTANADSATVAEDGSITVTVLTNDTDPENDTLDVTAVTQGANGSVALNANEAVTYTPNANFSGTDSFTYTISDGNGGTATATVTVTITGTNDAPVANADAATVTEDGSVSITVLSNDTDPENDTLDVTAVTQGTNGSVVLNANETVTYTPNANFNGTDSFTYTISDGNGGTATATVTITVTTDNDGPTANADSATVAEDGSITVTVLSNDSDPENDMLDVTAVTQGANGSVTLNANETVTYVPNANFHGADSFTYTISDGNGGTATATVTITVTSVNDEPVANADGASVSEDDSVTIAVLGNDTDADNDVLSVTGVTQGANGSVTINPDKTVTYTPVAGYNGPDTFTYTVSDGNGGTATASVSVSVGGVNDTPIANADTATVAEDASVNVAVLTNDSDPDNDALQVASVTQGAHGSVTINPNQTVTYTPVANYNGSDSFTYTASDGNGGTATASVTVTITAVNDAPVAVNDTASTIAEVSVVIPVLNNDVDIDGPSLTILSVTQPANGTVSVNGNQTLNYTPPATFRGVTSFTYTVTDSAGGTATATVEVTVNAPPRVATNLQVLYEMEEGSGTTVTDTSGVGTPLNLTIDNVSAVSWITGGLSVNSATLIQSAGAATKVITASQSTNAITIEAWVEPASLSQSSPVVTVSQQSNKRNFTLGQSGNRWDGRLRTSNTNQQGSSLTSAVGTATLNPTHVVYTRDAAGAVRIYVDGVQSATTTLSGNFSSWTGSYKLGLANELSTGSPWLGDLFLVAIYNRALSASEVRQNWLAGE